MNIISVINYKGGVGKTTVTANIAGELAYRGYKVLLLDMDAQASLTFSLMSPDFWDSDIKDSRTIKSWFDCLVKGENVMPLSELVYMPEKVNDYLAKNSKSNGSIDLISSHLGLINVDLELATLLGGANLKQSKANFLKVHGKLKGELKKLEKSNEYDIVLIDCPPNFNIVTKNAIIASDKILVPAKPDYLSTLGMDYLQRNVKELIREYNDYAKLDTDCDRIYPRFLGIVFTMIQIQKQDPIKVQKQFISRIERSETSTFDNFFRENKTIFADAPQEGIPIVLGRYRDSKGTYGDIITEIGSFVDQFIKCVGI